MYTFRLADSYSNFSEYYDQDLDRVVRSSGSLTGREYVLNSPQQGGFYLGVTTAPAVQYKASPIRRSGLSKQHQLSVGRVTLTVGDPGLEIAALLGVNPENLRGAKVVIRRTYSGLDPNSVDAYRTIFKGVVTNYSFDEDANFSMEVSDRWFDWQASVNKRTYNKLCSFRFGFKGSRCGYAGAEIFCDKTLPRCTELNNEANYGGFQEISNARFTGLPIG